MSGTADGDPTRDDVALARTALARARAHARAGGRAAGRAGTGTPTSRWRVNVDPDEELRSGPGPDARDPQPMKAAIDALVSSRGWQDEVAVGALVGRWAQIVGPDVAAHVSVESVRPATGGADDPGGPGSELVLRADSTAWATQVRLLLPALRRRLDDEVGAGVISRVRVLGPSGPSWRAGPRHVAGRGPRDTYG